MATKNFENTEIYMNADACSGHCSGFRLGGRNDKEKMYHYDISSVSSLGPIQGSIRQECRNAQSARSPLSVSLGRSETKTRGSIIAQSGRSMVEMLGTLAVIGILSIGGIVGYNYAINKYRANETINEINMRLLTLQTQSERDMDLNLNEFDDKTPLGYMIGDNYGWAEDDTRVYVGVSGIPQGACEIIYDEMITKVERIDVTADRTADINTLCGDNNEMKFYVGSGVEVACDPVCGDDEYCMAGIKCVKKWENTATRCSGEIEMIGDCEICQYKEGWSSSPIPLHGEECQDGMGICSNGICIPKEDITSCGDGCPSGQYCAHKKHTVNCNPPQIGCVPIEFSPVTIELSNGTVETWYKSNKYITWSDAMAACDAMGKKIPSKAEWDKMPEHKAKWTAAWSSTDKGNCTAYTTIAHAPVQGKSFVHVYAYCR